MKIRLADIVGLLVTGAAALVQEPNLWQPVAAAAATAHAQRLPATNRATARPAPDQSGTLRLRGAKSAAKGVRAAAIPAAYMALPDAERLAIRSDLAWLGDFDAGATKDSDERTVAAIKLFQQHDGGKETGVLSAEERVAVAAAAKRREDAVGWQIVDDAATGARLGLPTKLVPQADGARTGSRWTSPHGQIQIETFRLHEGALPALFDEERVTPRYRAVAYSELKPDSFVIAGTQGLKKFLIHAEASGGELRGVTILYDQATEGVMAPVALAMVSTFQGFPDASAGLPPGEKRSVEYATAIVVSGHGHLLTLRQATDDCQSITIPGLGHAERIAEDKATGLALLRLYGAQNLNPAALGGEDSKADNDVLVGVADPLAQAGAGAVTSVPAHTTAQGIEPAPAPGFAGAAAIDVQGRFAGVVELNSAVVAGPATGAREATLVPAAAVRAFLGAQGITPASGHAAMAQSVVRVICVRK